MEKLIDRTVPSKIATCPKCGKSRTFILRRPMSGAEFRRWLEEKPGWVRRADGAVIHVECLEKDGTNSGQQ